MEAEAKKSKKWWIILLCIAGTLLTAAAVILGFWLDNKYTLEIVLNGEKEVSVEYGEAYAEQGATAIFYGTWFHKDPVEVEVTVTSEVQEDVLGTYKVTYSAEHKKYSQTAERTVTVLDTKAPVITLVEDENHYTNPGEAYEEDGFTATDNYDGDITAQVTAVEKDGVVTYTVSDSSGNSVTQERTIRYRDNIPPVLKLAGESYITISAGAKFSDPGYSATDNLLGDITGSVVVSGGVDPYKPGSYVRTYYVEDNFGNSATVTRTVTVLQLKPEQIAPPNGKVIYLTFDDGPSSHTGRLLDILGKYNVKASFFVVNTAYIDAISRQAQEGHTVAIHSATHRFQDIYSSDAAYYADLERMQSIIENKTGIKTMLLRFPGGSSNTISKSYNRGIMTRLVGALTAQGYSYFDWNVDSNDAGGAYSSEQVFQNVVSGVSKHNNSVVLQHDTKGFSVDAVEKIIIWGLTNGYTFQALNAGSPGCHHGVLN